MDGLSRQLARYIKAIGDRYLPSLDVWLIYRLDRFGRGGHHRPFADLGFPAVRLMEAHENYARQHQDIRVEGGVAYGDVIEGVDFDYARKVTALDAAVLAALSWAPGAPRAVQLRGAVQPAASLSWQPPADSGAVSGYRVYWRRTDSPTWDHWEDVGRTHHPPVRRPGDRQLVLRGGEREPRGIHERGDGGGGAVARRPLSPARRRRPGSH